MSKPQVCVALCVILRPTGSEQQLLPASILLTSHAHINRDLSVQAGSVPVFIIYSNLFFVNNSCKKIIITQFKNLKNRYAPYMPSSRGAHMRPAGTHRKKPEQTLYNLYIHNRYKLQALTEKNQQTLSQNRSKLQPYRFTYSFCRACLDAYNTAADIS